MSLRKTADSTYDQHQHAEQSLRQDAQSSEPSRYPAVEPAEAHLGREHHERKEQDDRRQVNGLCGFLQGHDVEADQRDSPEQRDTGAIELQERQATENHAKVDDEENDDDGRGHDLLARLSLEPIRSDAGEEGTHDTTASREKRRARTGPFCLTKARSDDAAFAGYRLLVPPRFVPPRFVPPRLVAPRFRRFASYAS